MEKGSKMTLKSRKLLSASLKEYFKKNSPWNKGKKFVEIPRNATFFRKDKKYYLNELKDNAIRSVKKRYGSTKKKKEQSSVRRKEVQEITGVHRPMKYWSTREIIYLRKNYKIKTILEMALELERSWASVEHKLNRMELTKYHNWTK